MGGVEAGAGPKRGVAEALGVKKAEFPEATVSRGGGSGQPGQVPPTTPEDLATCRSQFPLQRSGEEKPLWRGLRRGRRRRWRKLDRE